VHSNRKIGVGVGEYSLVYPFGHIQCVSCLLRKGVGLGNVGIGQRDAVGDVGVCSGIDGEA